jgi:anti-sigma factor ChrR (cupin superfamily)
MQPEFGYGTAPAPILTFDPEPRDSDGRSPSATVKINADLTQPALVRTASLPWVPSPLPGVERRMLDRDGGEVARATSLVRYAPGSFFSPHTHELGEEFLVLEGVFSDQSGDFGTGYYVRNPPGSSHSPHTNPGCVIFVKLRQMQPTGEHAVVIDTTRAAWEATDTDGYLRLPLYANAFESVTMERLLPGAVLPARRHPGGEEILVVAGSVESAEFGTLETLHWLRQPSDTSAPLSSRDGATLWVKRGHLRAR